jgi:DNA-directed RNA polymerase sigma subunit (sigma70/sigma32)
MVDKVAKMRKVETSLGAELWREPTDEEIADATWMSEYRVRIVREASMSPKSLNAPWLTVRWLNLVTW